MPAIDVSLIRGINKRGAVRTERGMLHFKLARRKQRSSSTGGGHGIEMQPAVELAGKDDAVACGPIKLLGRGQPAKDTALPGGSLPHFVALAGLHIRNMDRPWQRGGTARREFIVVVAGGTAQECDFVALRRPCRLLIVVGTGVEISERLGRKIVDTDKAVIAALAYKGEVRAIGREPQRFDLAARMQQLFGLGC